MRIAFLIHRLEGGGAERQMALLAEGLHRRGHGVQVISFYGGGQHRERLQRAGVPCLSLDKRSRYDALAPLARLLRELQAFRPQILHGYLNTGNLLATACTPFLPASRLVWGVRASHLDLAQYSFGHRVLDVAEQALRSQPDLIIANARAGRDHLLQRGFQAARIAVVPNGIDAARFRRDEAGRAALRASWGLPPTAPLIGLVGRLDPMKDHPTFFRALARLVPRHPELRALVLGRGASGYAAHLRSLAEQLGLGPRLLWEEARTDLPQVYSALDLLCLPSSMGEGFSNVLGEALACGTPCVATRVGDADLLLPGDRLTPVGDPQALAAALARALASDPTPEAQRGRNLIHTRYTLEALTSRTEALLEALL